MVNRSTEKFPFVIFYGWASCIRLVGLLKLPGMSIAVENMVDGINAMHADVQN